MPIIINFSDLDLTKEYTYSDYLLWQFSERVELIKEFFKKMSLEAVGSTSSRGLATKTSPLWRNKNRKKKRTMNRTPAIAFEACYR